MTMFSYTARSKTGERLSGSIDADNKTEAIRKVEKLGLVPVSLRGGGTHDVAGRSSACQSRPPPLPQFRIQLDCSACKQTQSMIPTEISRMSPVVVTIGWILCIPSLLGVALAVLIAMTSLSAASQTALGATLGLGMAFFFGIPSLVGGLIGYLLIMKKKVFRCTSCGFILDRA